MRLAPFIAAYRWPIYLGGLLTLSVTAHALLVFVATRPSTPAPLGDYYDRAERWEADQALLDASAALGWQVEIELPGDAPFALAARRPIDVAVRDAEAPVTGLRGRLLVSRPDASQLSDAADLIELPHAPGHYRALVALSAAGLWQLTLDLRRGETRFVHQRRVELDGVRR